MNEWMNEWRNGWMNEWINEWINEWWMNKWMNGWMNEWMNKRKETGYFFFLFIFFNYKLPEWEGAIAVLSLWQ